MSKDLLIGGERKFHDDCGNYSLSSLIINISSMIYDKKQKLRWSQKVSSLSWTKKFILFRYNLYVSYIYIFSSSLENCYLCFTNKFCYICLTGTVAYSMRILSKVFFLGKERSMLDVGGPDSSHHFFIRIRSREKHWKNILKTCPSNPESISSDGKCFDHWYFCQLQSFGEIFLVLHKLSNFSGANQIMQTGRRFQTSHILKYI